MLYGSMLFYISTLCRSIFQHVMRLVQEELGEDIGSDSADSDCGDDVSIDSDSSDGAATYSVCSHEAMGCYKSALAILSRLRRRKEKHTSLYVDVLTKLGDCSIMVGEYERSILCYEEALYLCQNTLGSVSLTNSAHILSMLGTTNFLLGTYSKAATMYETANILQQHLYGLDDNFEMAFTMSMLGNTYYVMRQYHKCIAWCIKAFELYVNIYKQEIIFVDSLHRWFIAHTLYCLGFAYSHLNFHDKAIHNLDLAKNMIERAPSGEVDLHQHVKILKVSRGWDKKAYKNMYFHNIYYGYTGTYTAIYYGYTSTYTPIYYGYTGTYTAIYYGYTGTYTAIYYGYTGTYTPIYYGYTGTYTAIYYGYTSTYIAIYYGYTGTYKAIYYGDTGTYTAIYYGYTGTYTAIYYGYTGTYTAMAEITRPPEFCPENLS